MPSKVISDKELYDSIIALIRRAKSSLVISSPWIYNCGHLLDELQSATKRGIQLFVVMRPVENDMSGNYSEKLSALAKITGCSAKIFFDPRLHEKVIVCDKMCMVSSSANLIGKSLTSNSETGTYIDDGQEINKYLGRIASKYGFEFSAVKSSFNLKELLPVGVLLLLGLVLMIVVFYFNVDQLQTISEVLALPVRDQVIVVTGFVLSEPLDYKSQKGNLFQVFYLTDEGKNIKVFCEKDLPLQLKAGQKVRVKGQLKLFSDEKEVTGLKCSEIRVA